MPYLDEQGRENAWRKLREDELRLANAGQINFLITSICSKALGEQPDYVRYNAVIGALECAKLELYRRMVAPYEDAKARQNGDVY